jgi:DNA-binding PadR family transcriptional regulator
VTDEQLLKVVAELRDADREAYGIPISEALEARGIKCNLGALYVRLNRLVRSDHLVARMVPGGPERGNQQKRLYDITGIGRRALEGTK